jgi:acyl-CoA reductase-like NAD-dependent aldehyde dehydrogenase
MNKLMEKVKNKQEKKKEVEQNGNGSGDKTSTRLPVLKTYKLYIDGKFPRTESGRYFQLKDSRGDLIANMCRASRKDFRDAVVAARKAQTGWTSKSAYNRGQILYRLAEMLEDRREQFVNSLVTTGSSKKEAQKEVELSVDRLIYYAGWTDKFIQVFSSVNPVESSHFNFSVPEPTGVVSIIAPQENGFPGLVSVIAPVIAGGNTCIVLASEKDPLTAVNFSEVIGTSDVPGGVINILTGFEKELASHFASHMDVNAIWYCGDDKELQKVIKEKAAGNVKRAIITPEINFNSEAGQSPYLIMKFQEIKTTWHPVGY